MTRIKTTENALRLLSDVRRGQWFVHDHEALFPVAMAFLRGEKIATATPRREFEFSTVVAQFSESNSGSAKATEVAVIPIVGVVTKYDSCYSYGAVTEYKAVQSLSVGRIVQQFKAEWVPKGGTKFKPLIIKNYHHKVNFAIIPAEVGESWLFHLYDEGLSPDQMSITRYIVDNIMLPKITEDIETVMISKAKYVEDSQKTEDTMDGFETILVEDVNIIELLENGKSREN